MQTDHSLLSHAEAWPIILSGVLLLLTIMGAWWLDRRRQQGWQRRLQRYAAIVDRAPEALSLVDRDHRYQLVNAEYQRRTGLRRDQIEGRPVAEIMGQRAYDEVIAPSLERALAGNMVEYEAWFELPALGPRFLLVKYSPYRDDPEGARVDGVLVCARDITEIKRAEEAQRHAAALRESERRARALIDALPSQIWLTDANGRVEFGNQGLRDFFDLAEDAVPDLDWPPLVHEEDRAKVRERFGDALRDRRGFHQQCRLRRADGVWRWFDVGASARLDERGEFAGLVGANRDITRRKQLEQALRRSRGALKQRSEQLARLAAELTRAEQRERRRLGSLLHDHLQQLLVGAGLAADRLARHRAADGKGADGNGNNDDTQKLRNLLDEALEASRTLMADLCPPILYEAGLAEALRWLARSVSEKMGLRVSVEADPDQELENEMLRVFLFDSVREALLNVVKHGGVAEATVRLRRAPGNLLQVEVSDAGRGFDAAAVLDGRSGGDGLGLVAIRERMRLLGGRMQVDAAPGQGTRVRLSVPLAPETVRPDSMLAPAVQAPATAAAWPESRHTDKTRVLLVDDHVVMRDGLSMLLADEPGVEVVGQASNGREAVAQVEALMPDLVLMDFSMPEMDGVEATRIIHGRWPAVRVLGLSLYQESDRAEAMIAAGACGYVCKTGGSEELLAKIRGARRTAMLGSDSPVPRRATAGR